MASKGDKKTSRRRDRRSGDAGAQANEVVRAFAHQTKAQRKRSRRTVALKAALVALLLAGCVIVPVFVNDAIGYMPVVSVVAAIAVAFGYLQLAKRGLSFEEMPAVVDCQRGEDVPFTVRFSNRLPIFYFRVEAHLYVSDQFGHVASENMTTLTLSPFESYDLTFNARFDHIGTHSAGLKKVVVCDFFRLFTATVYNDRLNPVQVLPRIQTIEEIAYSNDALVENARAAKAVLSDSLDYSSVREYAPGDPLKTIHWKLSARGESYYTRLFEVYTNPGVAVVLDFYGPSKRARELASMFDCVVETGFSVEQYSREQGMETEILYRGKHGERVRKVGWTRDELPQMIEEMPRMSNEAERQVDAIDILHDQVISQRSHNNLVVCTANLSSEMVSLLIEAKLRGKEPLLFAVVPSSLVDRERDDYTASLSRLASADIGYLVLSRSDEVSEVSGL